MTDNLDKRPQMGKLYDMFTLRAQDDGQRGDGSGFWHSPRATCPENQAEIDAIRARMEALRDLRPRSDR